MACGFDKGLIAAYYDGEADPAERAEVERHVASCPECARDLADMKELTGRLKSLGRAAAPATLAPAVAKEIGVRRAAPSPRRWMGWSLSAAAALFLAIGTVKILDRPVPEHPLAVAPEVMNRRYAQPLEEQDGEAAKPPAPAAERSALGAPKKPDSSEPPVLVVSAPDPAKARAEVEAFLKERERGFAQPTDRFGEDDAVKAQYLEVELTAEEASLLEARLRRLESVTVAKSTVEEEKKSLARDAKERGDEGLAQKDKVGRGRAAAAEKREEPGRKALESAPRKPVIFVFRQAPKK